MCRKESTAGSWIDAKYGEPERRKYITCSASRFFSLPLRMHLGEDVGQADHDEVGRGKEEERRRRHGGEELVSRERFPHQQLFAATPSVEAKKNLFRVTGAENPGRKKKRPGRTSKS